MFPSPTCLEPFFPHSFSFTFVHLHVADLDLGPLVVAQLRTSGFKTEFLVAFLT